VERLKASWAEHDAILQQIFSGDGEAAGRLTRAHMLMASTVYADYASSHEHPEPDLGAEKPAAAR
jgi:DNA-binding GntR family transcriptional regulator